MGLRERQRGKRGERQWRDVLRSRYGCLRARRGQQRSGLDQSDVADGIPHTHPEVKYVEKLNFHAALDQATNDSQVEANIPYVASRRNAESWKITCWVEHWLPLSVALVRQCLAAGILSPNDLLAQDPPKILSVWPRKVE